MENSVSLRHVVFGTQTLYTGTERQRKRCERNCPRQNQEWRCARACKPTWGGARQRDLTVDGKGNLIPPVPTLSSNVEINQKEKLEKTESEKNERENNQRRFLKERKLELKLRNKNCDKRKF